jgi:hypothetical protein
VFDERTGLLLWNPCYVASFAIRQICYLLYKYEVAATPEIKASAFRDVIELDRTLDESVKIDPSDKVFWIAEQLIAEIFRDFNVREIVPRHGPGATNEGQVEPWKKYDHLDMYEFDDLYGREYFVASPGLLSVDQADCADIVGSRDYEAGRWFWTGSEVRGMSRVSAVPKTSSKVRVISAEPAEKMWLQLGVGEAIAKHLDSHPLTRGHFNFKDQSVNGRLALEASKTGLYATLDMKSASDRVSRKLCAQLLPTSLFRVLDSIRSTHSEFPEVKIQKFRQDKRLNRIKKTEITVFDACVHELSKMAPMGNGFCFPLESLVFWALSVAAAAVCIDSEAYVSEETLEWVRKRTYAYGDDLIVLAVCANDVMQSLQTYGFVFNERKTFTKGPFRESCGVDAFLGVDITPLRIKKQVPQENCESSAIIGWWDMAQECEILLPRVAEVMRQTVFAALGHKPTYPSNWKGCIGDPTSYADLVGRVVKQGEVVKASNIKWKLPKERGAVLEKPHVLAPSDGKVVKVLRNVNPSTRPPEDVFSEIHRYLRALCIEEPPCQRVDVLTSTASDTKSFTLRYSNGLRYERVFVA